MWIEDPFVGAEMQADAFSWPKDTILHQDGSEDELTLSTKNGGFELTFANMEAWIEADARRAQVSFDRTCICAMPEAYHRARVLFPLMRLLRGHLAFHASCISLGGRGILFMAPSGVGKTTAAAALVAYCSAKILADDIVTVSRSDEGYVAWPCSQAFAMRHRLLDGMPHFGDSLICGIKRMLPVQEPWIERECVRIDRVIFLQAGEASLTPLSLDERPVRFLSQQFVLSQGTPFFRQTMFEACTAFMAEISAYTLGMDGSTAASLRQFSEKFSS